MSEQSENKYVDVTVKGSADTFRRRVERLLLGSQWWPPCYSDDEKLVVTLIEPTLPLLEDEQHGTVLRVDFQAHAKGHEVEGARHIGTAFSFSYWEADREGLDIRIGWHFEAYGIASNDVRERFKGILAWLAERYPEAGSLIYRYMLRDIGIKLSNTPRRIRQELEQEVWWPYDEPEGGDATPGAMPAGNGDATDDPDIYLPNLERMGARAKRGIPLSRKETTYRMAKVMEAKDLGLPWKDAMLEIQWRYGSGEAAYRKFLRAKDDYEKYIEGNQEREGILRRYIAREKAAAM